MESGRSLCYIPLSCQLTVRVVPSPTHFEPKPTSPEKSPRQSMSRELTTPKPTLPQADDIIIIRTKSHVMLSIKIMSRFASTLPVLGSLPRTRRAVELAPWAFEREGLRRRALLVFCATVGN